MIIRNGSRNATASKMEHFVILVKGFQPSTIITKSSILDVPAVFNSPQRSDKIFLVLGLVLLSFSEMFVRFYF